MKHICKDILINGCAAITIGLIAFILYGIISQAITSHISLINATALGRNVGIFVAAILFARTGYIVYQLWLATYRTQKDFATLAYDFYVFSMESILPISKWTLDNYPETRNLAIDRKSEPIPYP